MAAVELDSGLDALRYLNGLLLGDSVKVHIPVKLSFDGLNGKKVRVNLPSTITGKHALEGYIGEKEYSKAISLVQRSIAQARDEWVYYHPNHTDHAQETIHEWYVDVVKEGLEGLLTIGKKIVESRPKRGSPQSHTKNEAYSIATGTLRQFDDDCPKLLVYSIADFVVERLLPLNQNDAKLTEFAVRAYVREGQPDKALQIVEGASQPLVRYAQQAVSGAKGKP